MTESARLRSRPSGCQEYGRKEAVSEARPSCKFLLLRDFMSQKSLICETSCLWEHVVFYNILRKPNGREGKVAMQDRVEHVPKKRNGRPDLSY